MNPTLRLFQLAVLGGSQAVRANRGVNVGAVEEQFTVTELGQKGVEMAIWLLFAQVMAVVFIGGELSRQELAVPALA